MQEITAEFLTRIINPPPPVRGELTLETIAVLAHVPKHAKGAMIHRTTRLIDWNNWNPDIKAPPALNLQYWYGQNPYMNVGTYFGLDDNGAVEGEYTLEDLQQVWSFDARDNS
jgi:hypothetical protein